MIPLRRKLSDGTLLEGQALGTYIPRRRGYRHWQDAFSCALCLAKQLPDLGLQLAWDQGKELAKLIPADVDLIAYPPASRARRAAGFYFAGELAVATVEYLTGHPATGEGGRNVHLARPLRWQQEQIEGAGAAKQIMHQGGQGRKLGRVVEVLEDLTGRRACIIDDLATTLATAAVTAEALYRAGAESVCVVTLAATERTEKRPAEERERVAWRAQAKRLRNSR